MPPYWRDFSDAKDNGSTLNPDASGRLPGGHLRQHEVAPSGPVQAWPPLGALSAAPHPLTSCGGRGTGGGFPLWTGMGWWGLGNRWFCHGHTRGQGWQGEKRIPEVPVICAGVNAKPPGRQLFSVLEEVCAEVGCVCAEWRCLVGLRTSTDSRARLWLLGTPHRKRDGSPCMEPLAPSPRRRRPTPAMEPRAGSGWEPGRSLLTQKGLDPRATPASSGLPPRVPLPKDPGPRLLSPCLHCPGPALSRCCHCPHSWQDSLHVKSKVFLHFSTDY